MSAGVSKRTGAALPAGAPVPRPHRAVGVLKALGSGPADYQSDSTGNTPMNQYVTRRFANGSHSVCSASAFRRLRCAA